ncbi:MAG: hypothetical protein V4864_04850 [Pseudomonadota bacterium]
MNIALQQFNNFPELLILELRADIFAFIRRIGVTQDNIDLRPLMNAIVARMYSEDSVEEAIEEFVSGPDLADFYIKSVSKETLAMAVSDLSIAFFRSLQRHRCYAKNGVLYYAFESFLHSDVVLRRVRPDNLRISRFEI